MHALLLRRVTFSFLILFCKSIYKIIDDDFYISLYSFSRHFIIIIIKNIVTRNVIEILLRNLVVVLSF